MHLPFLEIDLFNYCHGYRIVPETVDISYMYDNMFTGFLHVTMVTAMCTSTLPVM